MRKHHPLIELGEVDKMLIDNTLSCENGIQIVLTEELKRLKHIFADSSDIFMIISFDGRIEYMKINSFSKFLNQDCTNQMLDDLVKKYVHPNDIDMTIHVLNEAIQGHRISGFENRFLVQSGLYKWLSWLFLPFGNENKCYVIVHEVSEQKSLIKATKKSNQTLENIIDNITDMFFVLDKQWKFIYLNKTAEEAFSKIINQTILGKAYWDVFPKTDLYFPKLIEATLSQRPVHFEALSILTDGWVTVNVYPSSEGISVYFKDISERKKLEKSFEDERKRLYALLDGLPGLVYVRTSTGKVVFANHNFKEIHGEPENNKCYTILFNKDEPCITCHTHSTPEIKIFKQWQCVIKDTIFEVYQHPFQDSDGTQLFLMQLLDITKRKLAEEELARLDRLNLVGELAASIAHEVRNPMTTVRGFLQILKSRDSLNENTDYFDLMISELDRANFIITEFLSFAKTKPEISTVVKLNHLVDSLYPLILADATNQDKLVILETEEVSELTMNEREIRQLILNLTRNGLEAMLPKGILKIMTYEDEKDIVLAIQDQGAGISDDILVRLGTPFLTTKEDGTGLGLSMCYRIAERHNAKIEVKSSLSGTTFFVRFNK